MSTPYSTIYNRFLLKIADYDLPQLSDVALSEYCNSIMESAITRVPKIEHDLSARDVINPDLITEIADAQEAATNETEEQVEINTEELEEDIQNLYIFPFSKTMYGRAVFEVPGLADAVADDTTFTIFILSEIYIRLLTFTKGAAETQDCEVQSGLSFKATYDGEQTFAFTNVNPRAYDYTIWYITYTTPNPDPSGTEEENPSQVITVDTDIIDQIVSEDELLQEEVFSEDLSDLEIEIIASQMVVEWINEKLNNTQLIHMFVGTKDESMASQANHIEKLIELKEKQRALVSVMARDEAYRKWVEESDA